MGNSFSKDGCITRVVEALPGGGFFTAIAHAAAGNPVHAVQLSKYNPISILGWLTQAAMAGFGTTAALAVSLSTLNPTASIIAAAGFEGLKGVFEEVGLSDDKKEEVHVALKCGNSNQAAQILLEEGQKKIQQSTSALSADAGGRRSLKSIHGTYLRAIEPEWKVDMVSTPPRAWENWYIEDWNGKVVLKGRGAPNKPGQFLRAHPNGAVDLVGSHPKEWEMWKPFKNSDGSWSFLSFHGSWLSADVDGRVYTVKNCKSWEQFWLERW